MSVKTYIAAILMLVFSVPYFYQALHELEHRAILENAHHDCSHHHHHHHPDADNPDDNFPIGQERFALDCYICDFEFLSFITDSWVIPVISSPDNTEAYSFACCSIHPVPLRSSKFLRAPPAVVS